MAKGKVKKGKNERPKTSGRVTRSQRRAMERSLSNVGLEDLDTQLRNLGLCTKNITGDGNCLFRSLSDQYYGHDSNHQEIRQQVCQFLRKNEENYKFFVEDDQSFEHHVECMSQDATYGGNMELAAFAKMKEVDIKVYQPGMIYIINGKDGGEEDENIQVLHIAYHSWEHYSSVRNIDGPISGPPEIKIVQAKEKQDRQGGHEEEEVDSDLSSKEKVILTACPGTNIRKIRRLLVKNKGDPDKVIDALYEPDSSAENAEESNIPQADKEEQPVLDHIEKSVLEDDDKEKADLDQILEEESVDMLSPLSEISNTELNELSHSEEDPTKKEKQVDEKVEEKAEVHKKESDEETEKKDKKPKTLSASERKKEKKQKQKEQKLIKDRAKAARKMQRSQDKADAANTNDTTEKSGSSQSMKEMYI